MVQFIFIGGCPRSGTTLLASLISNHSEIIAVPEAHFRKELFSRLENISDEAIYDRIQFLKTNASFRTWNIIFPEREAFANKPASKSSFAYVYEVLVHEFCKKFHPHKVKSYKWVIDHNPDNAKFSFKLKNHFPESGFIHIVRDGRAVASSVIPLSWGPNNIYDASTFWLLNLSFGMQSVRYYNDKGHQVSYESLLQEPEKQIKELINKFNICFEETQLISKGLVLPKFTLAQHQEVNKELNLSKISGWQNKLSAKEVYVFESLTFDMLKLLGYSESGIKQKFAFLTFDRLFVKSFSLVKNYWNKILFKINLR